MTENMGQKSSLKGRRGAALTTEKINKILGKHGGYLGCFPINAMPSLLLLPLHIDFSVVVNLDSDNLPGSHWIAIVRMNKQIEYFDLFGMFPPSNVQIWCNKYSIKWIHNPIAIQQFDTQICGQLCCYFIIFRSRFTNLEKTLQFIYTLI